MPASSRPSTRSGSVFGFRPSLSGTLLLVLLGVLWIAGGASRADASGQVVVRAAAWFVLVVAALFGERPSFSTERPVLLLLLGALVLALVQLVPLPPGLWQALPGRATFAGSAAAAGLPPPWRPWSLVPAATLNAAASLVVPFAVLVLASGLKEDERARLPGLMLGLVAASTLVGLVQFSAGGLDNPFINDSAVQVSGSFANRNHFALLLAFGCILAPVWAFLGGRRPGWRGPVAMSLVLLFALTILATGSRAGLVLGVLALAIGLLLVRPAIRHELGRRPVWVFPALMAGIVGVIAIVVLLSVASGRAVSIDRALGVDQGEDMRSLGLPAVLDMVRTFFPWGSGLGGFDPKFRMHEPFGLLRYTWFNHTHDDFLEIALDAGLPGLVLLACGLVWWVRASIRAWRAGTSAALGKAGSAMLLLVLVASTVDYPARTPTIMATMVLAAVWLAWATARATGPALPPDGPYL